MTACPAEPETVVVVTGGGALAPVAVAALPRPSFVVAADSGADHAAASGLAVDTVVGDLDSISPSGLAALVARGVPVDQHPRAKDQTDLELALRVARDRRPDRVIVVGGDGGRLDHLLANVAVLAPPGHESGPVVEGWYGAAHLQFAVPGRPVTLHGEPGSVVSLLALHGPVQGARTQGLRWALTDDALAPGIAWGLSNELLGARARVEVRTGTLAVIQPSR